jgi:hypothetical protein
MPDESGRNDPQLTRFHHLARKRERSQEIILFCLMITVLFIFAAGIFGSLFVYHEMAQAYFQSKRKSLCAEHHRALDYQNHTVQPGPAS